jgi:hypothetical protein
LRKPICGNKVNVRKQLALDAVARVVHDVDGKRERGKGT